MNPRLTQRALATAAAAARAAGDVMRRNWHRPKQVQVATQHDIKLELDVRCQKLIERRLLAAFPGSAVFGEEGVAGVAGGPLRWVVDPIDGTVNFTYGIPHACVSIALQEASGTSSKGEGQPGFTTLVGVVYDPFCDELWSAVRGGPARLNGRIIRVSERTRLDESVVTLGFGKRDAALNHLLPMFAALTPKVRKIRIMGAAALALTYVASGRFDAYLEAGVRLWDIAAGGLIVTCAGGCFQSVALPGREAYALKAHNGHLDRALRPFTTLAPPSPPRRRRGR